VLAALSRRPVFSAVFAGLLFVYTVPLFLPRYLPFTDYPIHVASAFVVGNYHNPKYKFEQYYDLSGWLHPYSAHRYPVAWLSRLVGGDLAYRLFGLCFILGVPFGVLALLVRNRCSPWAAVLSFPTLYNFPLFMGFVAYSVGTAALIWGFLLLERALERPRWPQLVIISLAGLIIFLVHAQAFMYWAGTSCLLALHHAAPRWRSWRAWLSLGATAACLLPGVALSRLFVDKKWPTVSIRALLHYEPGSVREKLLDLPKHTYFFWGNPRAWLYLLAFVFVILAALLVRRREGQGEVPPEAQAMRGRYALLFGALALGAMFLKEYVPGQAIIASRWASAALLLAPLLWGASPVWRGRLVPALATILVLLYGRFVCQQMYFFDKESRGFDEVTRLIPHGASYRCHADASNSPIITLEPYRHFGGYLVAQKGGLNGFLFRSTGVDFRPPYQIPQEKLYSWQTAPTSSFEFERYGNLFDYYIIKSGERAATTAYDEEGRLGGHFKKLAQSGGWRLYQRVRLFH